MRRCLPVLVVSLAGLVPRVAAAGTFADDGTFEFDSTAVAKFDFEGAGGAGGAGPTTSEDSGALSGSRVMELAPQQGIDLDVTLPKILATYRVSAWVRDTEVTADFEISYNADAATRSEVSALYPTGRVTSDGWVEVANDHLRVDGARVTSATVGFFAAAKAAVDAVEVVADGDASDFPAVPNATCHGVVDASACAPQQICMWNECRNVGGWVPPIPPNRDHVADYLAARMKLLFGPYAERQLDLPGALVAIDAMKHAEDRWTFWNGFTLAVRRLHDGHTVTSGLADFVLRNPRPLSTCFFEGDADLSHGVAPKDPDYLDVLVSHVGADHDLGLEPGDRLVAVDGVHPIAWARSLITQNWTYPGISNHETFAELASSLRRLIPRYASSIDVVRCDAASSTCGPVETISIEALPFEPAGTVGDFKDCDNRPLRHLASSPADHATGEKVYSGIVDASDATEKIYGMEWESMFSTSPNDGVMPDINAAIAKFTSDARGVVLDHRTGFGGTEFAPSALWALKVPANAGFDFFVRSFVEEEQPSVAEGLAMFAAAKARFQTIPVGSNTPEDDLPVALLLTEDVSFSDIWPAGMKGAPKVMLFAPYQTNGAFSTRFSFGYWLSMSYVIAVGDTIDEQGISRCGHGAVPDVTVLPRQSDLLAGKDTLFDAAIAWVRTGLKP